MKKTLLLFSLALISSGCSYIYGENSLIGLGDGPAEPAKEAPAEKIKSASEEDLNRGPISQSLGGKKPPVEVSIIDATVDSGLLQVKVLVNALTPISTKDVALALYGMDQGKKVREQVIQLSDNLGEVYLEAGKPIEQKFEFSAEGISEYQVKCSWGEDANDLVERASDMIASMNQDIEVPEIVSVSEEKNEQGSDTEELESSKAEDSETSIQEVEAVSPEKPVQTVSIKKTAKELLQNRGKVAALSDISLDTESIECRVKPCDFYYIFNATLENNNNTTLDEIDLAVGLFWQNDGQIITFPKADSSLSENEEKISIGSLNIAPFGKKRLKVKIDRAIPVVPGGSFVPNLRILSAEGTS